MGAFLAIYKPFSCASILFYIIISISACPSTEKGTVGHDPSLILSRREVVSVMTWSEFLAFLMFVIELFKIFLRVLRFVVKLLKKRKVTALAKGNGYLT